MNCSVGICDSISFKIFKMNQIPPLWANTRTISQNSAGCVRWHYMTFKWYQQEEAWNCDFKHTNTDTGRIKVTQEVLLLQVYSQSQTMHLHMVWGTNLFSSQNKHLQTITVDNINTPACPIQQLIGIQDSKTFTHILFREAAYTIQCKKEVEINRVSKHY